MIIRSQNLGTLLVAPTSIKVEYSQTVVEDGGVRGAWFLVAAGGFILGVYKSESRAIEELDEIEKAMNRGQKNYEVRKDY
ncbi:hypothetical protein [Gudongella sp. SC589]|uniref:hypothetical protein n=1 Tax=Gudongella sp. SC589 TaxID=3385990 RepID=UPI003904CF0E